MKTHKVIHRRKTCIGCNSCCILAPQTWKMEKEEGKSVLIDGKNKARKPGEELFVAEIFDCDLEDNKKAAEACPVNIISVEESK